MGDEPRPLRQPLERVVRALGAPSVDATVAVFDQWDEIVGPVAAEHTSPRRVVDGRLEVMVSDPAWATQLRWMEPEIIRRLGDVGIRSVEPRVAR